MSRARQAAAAIAGLRIAYGVALLVTPPRTTSVLPWFAASIAGDLADIGSTFAGRAALPSGSAPATALVAGASAAISAAAIAAAVER
jgi:hypothetical protein